MPRCRLRPHHHPIAGSPIAAEHPHPRLPKLLGRLSSRPRLLIGAGAGLVVIGLAAWLSMGRSSAGALRLSGRIEGYETDVGAKVGGRVEEVTVREGNAVVPGQLLVRLDDEEVQAQLRAAQARVAVARQRELDARSQIQVAQSRIDESRLSRTQAEQDNRGRLLQAQANLATAEARLEEGQARLRLARVTAGRTERLTLEGATSRQTLDQDRTAYASAAATVKALGREVEAARGALTLARTSTFNPAIRGAQLEALRRQLEQARAQLKASAAEVRAAQADAQQIRVQRAYLTVKAPIRGVVISRSVEPGAVVSNGRTLLTLLDPATVYLRGFIPEGDIGRVRTGQEARVYLDSAPDRPLAAKVAEIDAQASFTPENIYFQKDRVRQVFGVKLAITAPGGYAKPGMPADAEILTR
ncbi:MAG: efflux RND transporter periplasmic adaptor subunit [Cyanobium sp. CZS 25K]|nr:efflux RND transporter periplasmic adaptor subunit [Cyanobium sp. CZS25K]